MSAAEAFWRRRTRYPGYAFWHKATLEKVLFVDTIIRWRSPTIRKRNRTLKERSLDFEDAKEVFAGKTLDFPDERHDDGELRIITVGMLRGRMVMLAWTPRGEVRRIFLMRKANDREKKRFGQRLEES